MPALQRQQPVWDSVLPVLRRAAGANFEQRSAVDAAGGHAASAETSFGSPTRCDSCRDSSGSQGRLAGTAPACATACRVQSATR
jgi:hypothetical protein